MELEQIPWVGEHVALRDETDVHRVEHVVWVAFAATYQVELYAVWINHMVVLRSAFHDAPT